MKKARGAALFRFYLTRKRNTRSKAAYPPERDSNASPAKQDPREYCSKITLRTIVQ